MMVTCEQFVELVTEYLEDAMDAETRADFEAHVARCRGCETYLDQIRATVRQAGTLKADDLSPPARDRLLEAFSEWRQRR